MTEGKELTEAQAENMLRGFGDSKQNKHSFMTQVVKVKDTTRLGCLTEEELGVPKIPVRTFKELELFHKKITKIPLYENYFKELSEIQTSTSLSKEGILLRLASIEKKELADVSPAGKKENRGWFKSKNQQKVVTS